MNVIIVMDNGNEIRTTQEDWYKAVNDRQHGANIIDIPLNLYGENSKVRIYRKHISHVCFIGEDQD